jgi:hypothetical protein
MGRLLFLGVFGFMFHISQVFAADLQQFSADMLSRGAGPSQTTKICVSGKKSRMEVAGTTTIIRLDKNVMWILMSSENMYMEQPLDLKMVPKTSEKMEGEVERVPLGKEAVDGVQADKFKVTYEEAGSKQGMYQWLAPSGFPLKMEAVDGSWSVEYKNVSLGPQPDSLFEVPEGFQKATMPSFGSGSGMPSLDDIMSKAGKKF